MALKIGGRCQIIPIIGATIRSMSSRDGICSTSVAISRRFRIQRRRRRAELDGRLIHFGHSHQLFAALGCFANENEQYAGGERIKRAGMSDFGAARETAV